MSRIEGMTDLCDYRCQQSTIPVLNMIQASLYQTEFHNKLQSRPITADPKGVRSRDLPSTLKARQNSARRSSDVSHPTGRQLDDQNHQNLIERLVCRLPKELQTSIIEIVSMMAASKKRMKIFAERQNIELHEMKAAYLTANAELSTSTHKCEVYRELLSKLEKKYCEGYIDSEDDKTNKNYALNSILISDGGRSSYQDKKDHEDIVIDSRFDDEAATRDIKWYSPRKNLVGGASEKLPTSSSVKLATSLNIQIPSIRKWDRFGTLIGQPTTREKQISPLTSIVDKQEIKKLKFAKELNLDGESMRNTLLIITREKYRLTKKVEVLGNRVESLKQSLQHSELQCRHLQINLAEFTGDDKNNDFSFNLQATNSLIPKKKYFGPRDDVFRMMIEKRAIDPVESILQCRRMIEWMASIPKETFQLSNVMTHITSREMSKIFDVDMIFVFIIDSENKNQISKYSIRADTCETHLLSDTISSLVGEVINKEKILKFSQVILPEFNASIDGCPGILIQNFLSVPIKIQKSSEIIGVIHFINKCNGKVAFTELDEIISTLFASMTVSSILGCRKYQHLNYRADVLKSILSSPSALLSLLPSRDSSYKIKTHVGDILKVLENSFKVPLKCLKVKVFILSDFVYGCQKRLLVSRKDEGKYGLQFRRDSIPPLDYHSVNLGIPGHVMTSKNWSIATDGDIDMHYNPIVDIDSKGKSCVCVPIFNVEGDVIVCVEMILGPLSPKIHLAESRADGINFEEALQCLILSISAPLQLVIERIYENDGQKASLLKGSEDESSPVLHKCDSCDTVKEEIFASFSIEEKAHEDDQLNHLLSLGIIPSKISHDTVNSSESKILPMSLNHSSNSNSPRTLRTRRRLSV